MAKCIIPRWSAPFVVAASLTFMAEGAHAQNVTPAGASFAWSKSNAILGGSSALQAVLANQGDRQVIPVPGSRGLLPSLTSFRMDRVRDDDASSGRPNVFGSVALKVSRTPLDKRWKSVQRVSVTGAAARFASRLRGFSELHQLELVNRYVNRRVQYQTDQRRFGRADVWSSVNDTLRNGIGDCEDFAIAKLQILRAAGFEESDIYLVIARDLVRRSDHAVLVARAGGSLFVLDSATDNVLETSNVTDFRPIFTFASTGEWTHGYRVADAPTYASAATSLAQRSRSASLLAFNTGFSR